MSGLIYFIPDVKGLGVEGFPSYGLGDVLSDVETVGDDCIVVPCERGPDGRTGVMVIPKDADNPDRIPKHLGYVPEHQEWRAVKTMTNGKPARYIGWFTNDPPTIPDMRRKSPMVWGYNVEGGYKGCNWIVPVARRTQNDPVGQFPSEWSFDGNGKPIPEAAEKYFPLWEKSGIVWNFLDQYTNDFEDPTFPIADDDIDAWVVTTAIQSLAVNYRVGPHEMAVLKELKLLNISTQLSMSILYALVDMTNFEQFKKKETTGSSQSADESSKSNPGDEAESQTSTQVAAN